MRAAIGAALEFVNTIGLDQIEQRQRYLSNYLKRQLAELPGMTMLSVTTAEYSAPGSTIFEVAGVNAAALVPVMDAQRFHIEKHQRDGHDAIRVSTHLYNTTVEIGALVEALAEIAKKGLAAV